MGSTAACFRISGRVYEVNAIGGCVVCKAARVMLKLGVDPAEQIEIYRDGKPAFKQLKTVGWWAEWTVVETAKHGPRFRRRRPKRASIESHKPQAKPKDRDDGFLWSGLPLHPVE